MDDKPVVTTVVLDPQSWRLLRELAMLRAVRLGGKPSASAVVRELVRGASRAKRPSAGGRPS